MKQVLHKIDEDGRKLRPRSRLECDRCCTPQSPVHTGRDAFVQRRSLWQQRVVLASGKLGLEDRHSHGPNDTHNSTCTHPLSSVCACAAPSPPACCAPARDRHGRAHTDCHTPPTDKVRRTVRPLISLSLSLSLSASPLVSHSPSSLSRIPFFFLSSY